MPDSVKYSIPSLYADDIEMYLSSKDCDDIANILILKIFESGCYFTLRACSQARMLRNKLQIHSKKSKYMFIVSAYNIKHKVSGNPVLDNNVPIPYLGLKIIFALVSILTKD
jgi:hypothetical protein